MVEPLRHDESVQHGHQVSWERLCKWFVTLLAARVFGADVLTVVQAMGG